MKFYSIKKVSLLIIGAVIVISSVITSWWLSNSTSKDFIKFAENTVVPKPLEKYTIENLSKTDVKPGIVQVKEVIKKNSVFNSYLFSFEFDPSIDGGKLKKTAGQINIPVGDNPFPVILMLRGYIDQKLYQTGDGTRKAAEVFAQNGYITVAPDFLGYDGSEPEADNIFEARFQTYITVLSLIKSLKQVDNWNKETVFLWGHSNGGQIALTVLEITGEKYPTTLWAPVSKPFPYSILYYTDQSEDRGKLIRHELAKFEKIYDPDKYSLDLYLDRVKAPLQIHQGTADDAVPISWNDQLANKLLDLNLDVNYYQYPGANHNMVPSWNLVINRDLKFFSENLNY